MGDDLEQLTDQELLARTRAGEKEAYGILWQRHSAAGMSYAAGITRSDPEDLVVEAYTKILRAIRSGKGPQDTFRPYLYAAIRNASITRHHKAGDTLPGLEEVSSGAMSVEGEVISGIDSERISRVFYAMKPAQRRILWMSEVEERPVAEIAEELGISKTNVSTSTQRARQEFVRLWTQDHVRTDGVEPGSEHEYVLTHAGDYLAGNPRQRMRARVEAHLAECPDCVAKLDEAKTTANMFRSRLAPAITGTVTSVVLASDQAFGADGSTAAGGSGGGSTGPSTGTTLPRAVDKMFPVKSKAAMWAVGAAGAGVIVAGLVGLLLVWSPGHDEQNSLPVKTPVAVAPEAMESASPQPATPEPGDRPSPQPPDVTPPVAADTPAPARTAPAPAGPSRAASEPPAKEKVVPPAAIVISAVDGGPSSVCYPTASGTAQAGSTIQVGNGGSAPVAVRVDARGRWTSPALSGFTPGRHLLTASGHDQTADSAPVTIATPPQVAANLSGGRFVLTISYAVPGVPIEVSVDGTVVGSVTADGSGKASYERGHVPGADRNVSLRYHPSGCHGPAFSMTTGL